MKKEELTIEVIEDIEETGDGDDCQYCANKPFC